MKKLQTRKGGFTLIELMIVVAIIGILAAIAIPNFLRFQLKAKSSEGKTNLAAIRTAEQSLLLGVRRVRVGRRVADGRARQLEARLQRCGRQQRHDRPGLRRRSAGRPRATCTSATRWAPAPPARLLRDGARPTSTPTPSMQTWGYQQGRLRRRGCAEGPHTCDLTAAHAAAGPGRALHGPRWARASSSRRVRSDTGGGPIRRPSTSLSRSQHPPPMQESDDAHHRAIADPGGFTLTELMIVVALIGTMAAIAIPNFLTYQARSRAQRGIHQPRAASRARTRPTTPSRPATPTCRTPSPGLRRPDAGQPNATKMVWDAPPMAVLRRRRLAARWQRLLHLRGRTSDCGGGCTDQTCFTVVAHGDVDGDNGLRRGDVRAPARRTAAGNAIASCIRSGPGLPCRRPTDRPGLRRARRSDLGFGADRY